MSVSRKLRAAGSYLKLLSDYTGQGETALKVGSAVLIMVLIIGGFGMLNS